MRARRAVRPENGKLPKPNMLMTDRISLITADGGKYGKGEIKAELDIRPDLWFFDCHFEGDPVMPGCLGPRCPVAARRLSISCGPAIRAAVAPSALARSSSLARSCRRPNS